MRNNIIEMLYGYTEDGLKLMGCHYDCGKRDCCVVMIHGMNGSIIDNYFANVWGELFTKNDISFLFGHTRGYSYINKIPLKDGGTKVCGTAYELFEESIYDVDLWIKNAKQLGYKKIILLGHSLGCNKVINYLAQKGNIVDGVVLASPPDMVGLIRNEYYEPDYLSLIKEAEDNVKNNNPWKLLSKRLWDEHEICSATFLNYTKEESLIDNLPLKRNPEHFRILEKIKAPVLALLGSDDDIIIRSPEKDLKMIKEKAISCQKFTTCIFQGATHTYENHETEVGLGILDWIKGL